MIIVTFSGLDGCGKSTCVKTTVRYLRERGLHVRELVTLFTSAAGLSTIIREHICKARPKISVSQVTSVTGHRIRALPGNRTFANDCERPIVYVKRLVTYTIDCLILTSWLTVQKAMGVDAVVCDRYVYDKMVNLPSPIGIYSRFLSRLVPRPQLPIFLDVPPLVCRGRREEHPPDYYETKYDAYKKVVMQFALLSVVNKDRQETSREIERLVSAIIDFHVTPGRSNHLYQHEPK